MDFPGKASAKIGDNGKRGDAQAEPPGDEEALAKARWQAVLQRENAAEALRVAAVRTVHAFDNLSLCDDDGAEREIGFAISYLKEGAAAFRKMQSDIATIAASIRADAVR